MVETLIENIKPVAPNERDCKCKKQHFLHSLAFLSNPVSNPGWKIDEAPSINASPNKKRFSGVSLIQSGWLIEAKLCVSIMR